MAPDPDPNPEPQEPGRLAAINPLIQVGRLLPTALQDLRTIADGIRILPDLLSELAAIRERVTTMDDEVRVMRQGVDRLHGQVGALRESVDAELHEVGLAVHPVRRVTRRMRRRDPDA
jgi:cob(I)alamin adenosyltransferase